MSKSRIGIDGRYIQDHFPGIGRYTYNLIRALSELDDDVEYIVLVNETSGNSRYDLSDLERGNIRLWPVSVPTISAAEQIRLPREIKKMGLALLHSPYYVKPYFLPCPSVVTIHDLNSSRFPQSLPSAKARVVYNMTTYLAQRTAEIVITGSEFSATDLSQFFKVPRKKVAVTQYATDERYRPGLAGTEKAEDVSRRYSLPKRFMLYLGINKPLKNLVRLVEAYHQVVLAWTAKPGADKTDLALPPLVLAGGEDPRYPDVREKVSALSLQDRVLFTGPIAEADQPYLYSLADLFVFPSLAEGFGLPPLEAMACGTPVACSNASSLPEVVGDAALTFDPLNVAEIAAAIQQAMLDDKLREDLRQRSLERAKQFSWRRCAEETAAVYRRVIDENQ